MPQETKYTVKYFIEKFESIPSSKWTTQKYITSDGCCCAFGHCGLRDDVGFSKLPEASALCQIFGSSYNVIHVNDGRRGDYNQPTPDLRIIAFLKDRKDQTYLQPIKCM